MTIRKSNQYLSLVNS
ncbi:unnamed protein product [Debaryomyces tyrocola]|nr:unnamed protein product [Debaryomyces tyrocola]